MELHILGAGKWMRKNILFKCNPFLVSELMKLFRQTLVDLPAQNWPMLVVVFLFAACNLYSWNSILVFASVISLLSFSLSLSLVLERGGGGHWVCGGIDPQPS